MANGPQNAKDVRLGGARLDPPSPPVGLPKGADVVAADLGRDRDEVVEAGHGQDERVKGNQIEGSSR